MLRSFRWVRCSYTHFPNPSQHHLLSLRASAAPSQTDCCRIIDLEHYYIASPQLRSATRYIGKTKSICIGLLCCDISCAGIGKAAGQTRPKQSIEGLAWCCGQQLQQDVHFKVASHQYWNQSNALQFVSCQSCCFSSTLCPLVLGLALSP